MIAAVQKIGAADPIKLLLESQAGYTDAVVSVTLEFARVLPAPPEYRAALAKAEPLSSNKLEMCGLGDDDLRRRLAEWADTRCSGSRSRPLGA